MTKNFLMKNFIIAGAVATLAMFTNNLALSPEKEMKDMISQVQEKEGLTDVKVNFENSYSKMNSSAHMKTGKDNSKDSSITNAPYTTFFTKAFAPIEFAKTDSKLFSKFIILHELAHTELNHIMHNGAKPVDIRLEGVSDKLNNGLSNYIANYFHKNPKSHLYANYHENFADAYGSILAIKHLSSEHSDEAIKQVIKARYSQVYNQNNLLGGGMGDNAHKTEHSLQKILDTHLEKIRSMSKKESQDFAIKVASTSTIEQFPDIYKTMFKSLSSAVPASDKAAFSKLKIDRSFMDKITTHQNNILVNNEPENVIKNTKKPS